MLKKLTVSKKTALKRRDFLSRTATVGGMLILGTSAGSVYATGTANSLLNSVRTRKKVRLSNVTINDFAELIGQKFYLRTEDGTAVPAKLIETNSAKTRQKLRFRREHFSIVFDLPSGLELVQGQYNLNHLRVGSMDLFMVPVDLPAKHNRLEAVFS